MVVFDSGHQMRDLLRDALSENIRFLSLRPKKQKEIEDRIDGILAATVKDLGLQAMRL